MEVGVMVTVRTRQPEGIHPVRNRQSDGPNCNQLNLRARAWRAPDAASVLLPLHRLDRMNGRRVFPLSVDVSSSSVGAGNGARALPPPPKSPQHRAQSPTAGRGLHENARPPTGGSVGIGFMGFDRLTMMRQVNAAAAPTTQALGGEEASAAVNHRQRMAAEQQRRQEQVLMAREDYTGTPEGQARLQRQEERSRMREEELLVLRLVEMERQAARALQRQRELEEEARVRETYLARIREQREQQERAAREKEEARKLEVEKKMRALKEAADAKARAEFAERQWVLEQEARAERERHLAAVESVHMQVEDVVGHAMQQEMIAERERQQQIAAEQEEWRLFQERELEKQREATRLRRASMAQRYEQDKQRRLQIHKLQKERATRQAEHNVAQDQHQHQRQMLEEDSLKEDEEVASAGNRGARPIIAEKSDEVARTGCGETSMATEGVAMLRKEPEVKSKQERGCPGQVAEPNAVNTHEQNVQKGAGAADGTGFVDREKERSTLDCEEVGAAQIPDRDAAQTKQQLQEGDTLQIGAEEMLMDKKDIESKLSGVDTVDGDNDTMENQLQTSCGAVQIVDLQSGLGEPLQTAERQNVRGHRTGENELMAEKPSDTTLEKLGNAQLSEKSDPVAKAIGGPRICDIPLDLSLESPSTGSASKESAKICSEVEREDAPGSLSTAALPGTSPEEKHIAQVSGDIAPGQEELVALCRSSAAEEAVGPISNAEPQEEKQEEVTRPVWSISVARAQGILPFAQVFSVMEQSPAMQATLQSGDLLIEFGGIVSTTPKCLMAMAECVQENLDRFISVRLLRPTEASSSSLTLEDCFEEFQVSLGPRKWKGKGLLGCQLSPFKWPIEEPVQPSNPEADAAPATLTEETCRNEDGTNALVVYDVVAGSVADQAGLADGDILAGCDGMAAAVSVATIAAVVDHIQATRAAHRPVHVDIQRWIMEEQCYRSLRVVLSPVADSGPLGCSLTSFAEYYNYNSKDESAASACEECYYTTLTTALHAAALNGHVACLKALLDALQNQQNGDGGGGGYSASDYLDWRDEDGRTPLFYACYAAQLGCVRFLLSVMVSSQSPVDEPHSFNIGSPDLYGDTILHAASTSGSVEVVALLLEGGYVGVDERNHARLTCAHVAPNVEILTLLGERFEADLLTTDTEERMPLAYACLRNDGASIEYLCGKHPDFVDYADVHGNTPLHVTACQGLREACEVLARFLPAIALYLINEEGRNAAEEARSSGMEDVAGFLEGVMAAADASEG
ncbi:hypothetical protein BBJ28_00014305 [Nothophytophthora sp. Chile5]|nr:hypothetical protein BBJ28_00014305 [Nothophytophthora sp. Chile5]